jgi:Holliday junction resolvase RusA-like endonuclease
MISFRVPVVPVPQPRPRAMIQAGHVHIHTPTTRKTSDGRRVSTGIVEFKTAIARAAEAAYKGPPLDGPLDLQLVFLLPRPKSMVWKTRPMPRAWHQAKPDLDNLVKAVKDALKGLTWRDDSQIGRVVAVKWYASIDEPPGVEVEIDFMPGFEKPAELFGAAAQAARVQQVAGCERRSGEPGGRQP